MNYFQNGNSSRWKRERWKRTVDFYNLDAIIAVGYRVNSKKATKFRQWATKTLKDYIIKGFAIDKERLKNASKFGKDYFDELLKVIKEIGLSGQVKKMWF